MVGYDILAQVNDAVLTSMRNTGIEDTPQNRIKILRNVHQELSKDDPITHATNQFLLVIEREVARLESEI